MKVAVTLITK